MTKEKAKELYEQGCNAYLQLFCEKHDFDFEDAQNSWTENDIVECGDYFVGMQTIIEDIENNLPEELFFQWYQYCLDAEEFGLSQPNLKAFAKGCPITTQETFERFRKLKEELNKLIEIEIEKNK
jgi:hypothetical protein